MSKKYQIFIDTLLCHSGYNKVMPPSKMSEEEISEMQDFLTAFLSAITEILKHNTLSRDKQIEEYERICKELIPWHGKLYTDLKKHISLLKKENYEGCTRIGERSDFYNDLLKLYNVIATTEERSNVNI